MRATKNNACCCGEDKMCSLCCPCRLDLRIVKPLVNKPRFICGHCGRVANRKENLCRPAALR